LLIWLLYNVSKSPARFGCCIANLPIWLLCNVSTVPVGSLIRLWNRQFVNKTASA
jgi:hypothetical protein